MYEGEYMIYDILGSFIKCSENKKIGEKNVVVTTQHVNVFPYVLIEFVESENDLLWQKMKVKISGFTSSAVMTEVQNMHDVILNTLSDVKNKVNKMTATVQNVKFLEEKSIRKVEFVVNYIKHK